MTNVLKNLIVINLDKLLSFIKKFINKNNLIFTYVLLILVNIKLMKQK